MKHDRQKPTDYEVEDAIWQAMTEGVREFVRTHGNGTAVIGISGGVDSALVAAAAAEALGPEHVRGALMPSPHTSRESLDAAAGLAKELGLRTITLPITPIMESFGAVLAPIFADLPPNVAEDNLQARIRGTLLMAVSNKFGCLVLNTGNRSEGSVGYCTLYGDSCGALAVIGDLYKREVYAVCRRLNARKGRDYIPAVILTRPPSAELYPGQKDEDALPPYPVLDALLYDHQEQGLDEAALVRAGHDRETVRQVLNMIRAAEFKRRQSPPALPLRGKIPAGFLTGN
ncbi:MAG: NAD(+) synthase [Deltaproteobacteria bacterium]|jgi:NAD+ synthetase|nr:NAD(+) synthase [Deltaproteobacteria bacterium]